MKTRTRCDIHTRIRKEALEIADSGDLNLMIQFVTRWTASGVGPTAVEEAINASINPRHKKELAKLRGKISGVELLEDTEITRARINFVPLDIAVEESEQHDVEMHTEDDNKVEWSSDDTMNGLRAVVTSLVNTIDQARPRPRAPIVNTPLL